MVIYKAALDLGAVGRSSALGAGLIAARNTAARDIASG
jgi:hypothetical protein